MSAGKGLNIEFSSATETVTQDCMEVAGAELLVQDEDKAKWSAHWRAFTLGLPVNPEPGVPRFYKKTTPVVREYVTIRVPGQPDFTRTEVLESHRQLYAQEYAAWKSGRPAGTPISSLSAEDLKTLEMTPEMVRELASGFVDTLENLAELNDANVRRLMGGVSLRQRARDLLARRAAEKVPDPIQRALDALSARIDTLERKGA